MKRAQTSTWKIVLIVVIVVVALLFLVALFRLTNHPYVPPNGNDDSGFDHLQRGISYGEDNKQKFDFYYPKQSSNKLVIVVHGGAWFRGDKNYMAPTARYLADQSYAVANINYRWVNTTSFIKEQLDDMASVINYITSNPEKFKLSSGYEIILLGHSAGAHLSGLYGVTESNYGTRNVDKVIGLGGPYDLSVEGTDPRSVPIRDGILGDWTIEQGSATAQVQAGDTTKFLLILGQNDELVPYIQLTNFETALREKGVYVETMYVAGESHNSPIENFPQGGEIPSRVVGFIGG